MSILGLGIDIVEIERFHRALERGGERFIERIFTPGERTGAEKLRHSSPFLAVRFAAKEAVAKAFGTGIGEAMAFTEIEVHRRESGEPFIELHGAARATAGQRGVGGILISLSHTEHTAVAVAILLGGAAG